MLGDIGGSAGVYLGTPKVTKERPGPPRAREEDVPNGGTLAKHVGGAAPAKGVKGGGEAELNAMSPEPANQSGSRAEQRVGYRAAGLQMVRSSAAKGARATKQA